MEIKDFWTLIKTKKQTILSVVVLILVIVLVLTIIQPFKFEAKAKLIVIQEFSAAVDPYAISKSNEYLSTLLANVATSNNFYNLVLAANADIDRIYFKDTINKQIDIWRNTISAQTINDSGIIEISIYHPDTAQARLLINSVISSLQKNHGDFHGAPNKVEIKVLDEPMLSRWPVKPNLAINMAIGLGLGIVIALCYIYLFPGKNHDLRLVPGRKNKPSQENGISFERAENNWETIGEVLERRQGDNLNRLYDNSRKDYNVDLPREQDLPEEKEVLVDSEEKKETAERFIKNGNMKNIFGN